MRIAIRAALFLSLSVCAAVSTVRADELKVGVIAPLSGPVIAWGADVRNVLLFAQQALKAEQIKFIFEDDQCLGKNSVTAAHKLINVDRIDYGIVVCTESMLSTAPIFEQAKLLVIGPATSGSAVSNAGDFIFRTWPSDAEAGRLLFSYINGRFASVGVVTEDRGYSQELTGAFLKAAEGSKLKIEQELIASEDSDFKPLILKLKQRQVESVFINTNSERAFANAVSQFRQLSWRPPLFGVYMPGSSSFLALAGDAAEGIIFVDAPSVETSLTAEGKELYTQFTAEHGELQSSRFVFPSTFEVLRLLSSLKRGDERKQLYEGSFHGLFGPYSFDSNGDIEGVRHELKIIKNGKPVPFSAGEQPLPH